MGCSDEESGYIEPVRVVSREAVFMGDSHSFVNVAMNEFQEHYGVLAGIW